jgi:hypothetical protein
MRRTFPLLIAILMLVAAMTSVAAAGSRRTTYVTTDCLHVRTAPPSILFACGDGTFYVDHLTWSRWHTWKASGFGLFHQNDCRPSCAEGTFHTAWGHLWLRNRDRCTHPHVFTFQHVRALYEHRLLGHRRVSFGHLGCPLV